MDIGKPDAKARNPLDHPWRVWRTNRFSGYEQTKLSETSKHFQRHDHHNGVLRTFRKRNAVKGDRFARWGFDTPGCF